jgi:hypothetical protein
LKVCTTLEPRNTASNTNIEEEDFVEAPGNDGNASMPEQVKRPNPWNKIIMMMMMNNREDMLKQAFAGKPNKGKKYHASGITSWPSSVRTSRCLLPYHCA